MRIKLKRRYKSIATLRAEELPDFAVLIGRNGAGKTQFLDALDGGKAVIPGIGVDEIELYDMVSFCPPKTSRANRQSYRFAQATADAFLLPQRDGPPLSEVAAAIFDEFASDIQRNSGARARDDFERNLRDEVRHTPDFTAFAAEHRNSPYKKTLYEKVMLPLSRGNTGRRGRRSSSQSNNSFDDKPAACSAPR